jgi:hypothetical protein
VNVNEVGLGDGDGVALDVCVGVAVGPVGADEVAAAGCVLPAAVVCADAAGTGEGSCAADAAQPATIIAVRPARATSVVAATTSGNEAPLRATTDQWRPPLMAAVYAGRIAIATVHQHAVFSPRDGLL